MKAGELRRVEKEEKEGQQRRCCSTGWAQKVDNSSAKFRLVLVINYHVNKIPLPSSANSVPVVL